MDSTHVIQRYAHHSIVAEVDVLQVVLLEIVVHTTNIKRGEEVAVEHKILQSLVISEVDRE